MPEPFFQFKQFRVYQSAPGFKVGTDGVLLGAWAEIRKDESVLDIGTGTGLIALMIAQKGAGKVDAVEINPLSAKQAKKNFAHSSFTNLSLFNESVSQFVSREKKYDLIVCNPPFYSHNQPSKDESIRMAKHTVALMPDELFRCAKLLTKSNSRFNLIFPKTEEEVFFRAGSKAGFYPKKIVDVYPQPNYSQIRFLVEFVKAEVEVERSQFYIEKSDKRHDYSDAYKNLTNEYFLRF